MINKYPSTFKVFSSQSKNVKCKQNDKPFHAVIPITISLKLSGSVIEMKSEKKLSIICNFYLFTMHTEWVGMLKIRGNYR